MTSDIKIKSYHEVSKLIKSHKSIVKTGCFDLLHIGHLGSFQRCKKIAEILIVLVGSDVVLKKLYGDSEKAKPIFDESNRAKMIAALDCVDYVCILTEPLHHTALDIIRPTYYHIPNDDRWIEEKKQMCQKFGIEIVIDENSIILNYGKLFEPHTSNFRG
jgi:D-beta-D-heptose 7-phosphate kinase/D-beta-D-heptose 1-phosphate adenosyltransferase